MGGHVFALTGGKGGVGKTTTSANLGVALQQAGYDAVVVDADLAMADLGYRLALDCELGVHEVLAGETEIADAIVRGPSDLTVLSGGRDLDGFAAADPQRLPKTLELLSVAYDVVLVDTGPGVQQESVIAQQAADGAILVTSPRDLAVEDTVKTSELAAEADCPVVGVVVTRAEDERGVSEIADRLDTDLLAAVPCHPVQKGEPRIVTHPDGAAATAYQRLATALPIADIDTTADDPDDESAEESTPDASSAGESEAATAEVSESTTGESVEATADEGDDASDVAATDGGVDREREQPPGR